MGSILVVAVIGIIVIPFHYWIFLLFSTIVGGAVVFWLLWKGYSQIEHSDKIQKPSLGFIHRKVIQSVIKKRKLEMEIISKREIFPFTARIQNIFLTILDYFKRDFISCWARQVCDDLLFEEEISRILERLCIEVTQRFKAVLDLDAALMTKTIPLLNDYFHHFKADKVEWNSLIDKAINNSSALTANQSSQIFRLLCRDLIKYSVELLCSSLSDPDFLNRNINYLLGNVIHDMYIIANYSHDVHQFRELLNTSQSTINSIHSEIKKVKTFDEFMMLVDNCGSILDALSLKDRISMELAKRKSDRKTNPLYIQHLKLAKKKIQKKISVLTETLSKMEKETPFYNAKSSKNLSSVMKNSIGLDCFRSFMAMMNGSCELDLYLAIDEVIKSKRDDYDEKTKDYSNLWKRITENTDYLTLIEASYQTQLKTLFSAPINDYLDVEKVMTKIRFSLLENMENSYFSAFLNSKMYVRMLNEWGFGIAPESPSSSKSQHFEVVLKQEDAELKKITEIDEILCSIDHFQDEEESDDESVIQSPSKDSEDGIDDKLIKAINQKRMVDSLMENNNSGYNNKILKKTLASLSMEIQYLSFMKSKESVQEMESIILPVFLFII